MFTNFIIDHSYLILHLSIQQVCNYYMLQHILMLSSQKSNLF